MPLTFGANSEECNAIEKLPVNNAINNKKKIVTTFSRRMENLNRINFLNYFLRYKLKLIKTTIVVFTMRANNKKTKNSQ